MTKNSFSFLILLFLLAISGGQSSPPPPAPSPPEGGEHPPECRIPPKDELAAKELVRDINNNFNEPIRIAKICEQPSKTWFGTCNDTLKCDKQCMDWEDARHGACHERESKLMCFCYYSCDAKDKRPPVPPDCPPKSVEAAPLQREPTLPKHAAPPPPAGGQPAPPPSEGGKPHPPECRIPPKDKLAAKELAHDINNNFNEPIRIAKICEQPSKTWFGNCNDTLKCDKQCIDWEDARHGSCHQRESKYMCFCYYSCDAKDKRPPVPPDCPTPPPKMLKLD